MALFAALSLSPAQYVRNPMLGLRYNNSSERGIMNLQATAKSFAELCYEGRNFEVMRAMYAPDIYSNKLVNGGHSRLGSSRSSSPGSCGQPSDHFADRSRQ